MRKTTKGKKKKTHSPFRRQILPSINRGANSDEILQSSLGSSRLERHDSDIVDIFVGGEFEPIVISE